MDENEKHALSKPVVRCTEFTEVSRVEPADGKEELIPVNDEAKTEEATEEQVEVKEEVTAPETQEAEKKETKSKFFKKKNRAQEADELNKKIEELTQKIEEQGKTLEEMNDKYLRLTAEFDNYRKRTLKEKIELMKSGGENVLLGIIPVVDDFERAMQSITAAKELDAVKEGIDLIYGKFKEFLNQKGVKEIEALNQEFNTDLHEAVTKIPASSDDMKGKIVDVIEKGYTLYDKVIRFSKVVVGE
ncbi:MAG: nucleotide exchange factor GrpE [Bacteroidia bacterium]|nr:nucleotide exchange factor GrpE [Bacteroidia bacterium]